MERWARIVTNHPGLTLLIVLSVSTLLASGLRFAETRSILDGELPAHDPIVLDSAQFDERYPDRNFYTLGVWFDDPNGIWNLDTLRKIIDISQEAASLPGALSNVQSLATWDQVTGTAAGIDVRPLMAESPRGLDEVHRLQRLVHDDPLLLGRLVSNDGRMALVRVSYRGDATPDEIHAGLEGLRLRFEGPEEIIIYGREFVNAELDLAVSEHTLRLLPLAVVFLLGFLYLCFGRIQAVWATFSVILISVIDFIGMMGVLRIPQSILSSTVPVILIVALGSYVIHLLRRVYDEAEQHPWNEAVFIALARTGPAIVLAAASTATGLATLAVFQIYSVREFGILAAVGILIAALLSLSWLPAILLVFARASPPEKFLGRREFGRVVSNLTELAVSASRKPAAARGLALILTVIALVGMSRVQVGTNPGEFFPADHFVRMGFESILEAFDGDAFIFVEFTAPVGQTILEPLFLQRVLDFQRDAARVADVAYASSVVDRVFMRIHRKMNADEPTFERVPETRQLVAQYAEFFRWSAEETLAEMIESSDQPRRLVVDVFAKANDSAEIDGMIGELRGVIDRHFPTPAEGTAVFGGEYVEWIAQNRYIVRGKILNVILSIVFVGFVCVLVLSSLRAAMIAILPAGLAAICVLGLMGLVGIRLDLASCVTTAIVIGIGADFAIHFLLRYREISREYPSEATPNELVDQTIRCSAPPILYDSISNIAAFSVCASSRLVPVRDFGWLICISMLTCAAVTLTLLPGLLHRRSR